MPLYVQEPLQRVIGNAVNGFNIAINVMANNLNGGNIDINVMAIKYVWH